MALEKLENNLKKLENWEEKGYKWVCLGCNTIYKGKPEELLEDGHGGRYIKMCRCGSDLFDTIDAIREIIKKRISELKDKNSYLNSSPN